jgi:methylase of polypeptide subunit release factors
MPRVDDPATARALQARLVEIGFRPDVLADVLGVEEGSLSRGDRELQRRRLPSGEPLTAAAKLLVLGFDVPEAEARTALAPLELDALTGLGVVEPAGGGAVRSPVRIAPFDAFLVVSDRPDLVESREPPADFVGSINPTSLTLAKLTVRDPVESALDLGTGCGIQALLLSRHARHVVATDVNPRALEYARFNAQLNGIDNVETRQGSFFEPVEGETFGLVVSNPPFVISPDSVLTFRDSGLSGDDVSREVVRGAAARLEEGGFATVLCNWASRADEDWSAPPSAWVDGTGCDAWILHNDSEDPLRYAAVWNQLVRRHDPTAYAETLDRWVAYHREIGAERLNHGGVILRRRSSGRNWLAADELPPGAIRPAADHIRRVFDAHDHVHSLADEQALLDESLVLVEGHRVEQTARLVEGEYEIERATLTLDEGIAFEGAVDTYTLHVLARCDGRRTLCEALAEVAEAAGVDPDLFASTGLGIVRRLYELGFLVRPE